ncbi:PREDICTED: Fanconi anemia group G protein isoform X2 [Cyprinodon variegatus]|uniref:Fanconi anemia group G protein isoform X2 n=1 Tax=Cyprinodon variegatus TaxID=28743 RepID=UPI000742A9B3|nr:PREDICTED: Fanconi anemia group G protein isoform X2 [Cyprinodon variegatus]
MIQPLCLLDRWTQENNELASSYKDGQDAQNRDHNLFRQRRYSSDFHKLLKKIQGIPPHLDHAQLELSVAYNTCVCFTAQSQFEDAQMLLTQTIQRVLEIAGENPGTPDPSVLWKAALISVASTALHRSVLGLFCLQWGTWLAKRCWTAIKEFQAKISLFDEQRQGVWDEKIPNFPRLVVEPRRLSELLKICSAISQGAERLDEGWSTLSSLQAASALPAPRALIAYTHLLSGSCLAHMSRPQMALQCFRKALETDPCCVCALYQSILIYRQLGNSQAEIQALRILHSTLLLPSTTEQAMAGSQLLSPSLFLCSKSLSSLLSVPSALSVLHCLALKCVIHGRVSEGVEYYLDLLAALHSEDQHGPPAAVSILPKLPRLYLEAGAALLMARRPADCLTLCDEVSRTIVDLLPEKVIVDDPEEGSVSWSREGKDETESGLERLLWAAASYLLQGHCYCQLMEWKQAVTNYTRCINLVVKVHYKRRSISPQIPSTDIDAEQAGDLLVLQRLKGLSLAGRGISFAQMSQLREALRDLQLSLQAHPEGVTAGQWCGEVLWRLDRKQEAAAYWKKTWSQPIPSIAETLPVYAQELQSDLLLDSEELHQRLQELDPI